MNSPAPRPALPVATPSLPEALATRGDVGFWRMDRLASHVSGTWLSVAKGQAREADVILRGVSTDTRGVVAGQLFVALKGEKFDAHDFLDQALDRGASALLIHDAKAWERVRAHPRSAEVGVVLVRDTGVALLDLGGAYRRSLGPMRVLCVGGSNGKTTTVRLLHGALSRGLRVRSSAKSFNNAIGVPLTLLSARVGDADVGDFGAGDEALICEAGTNAPGELAPLAELIEPDIAFIISLGREHLEGLGDVRGVAREEASLLRGLRDGGIAIVQGDQAALLDAVHDEIARARAAGRTLHLHTFGTMPGVSTRVSSVSQSALGLAFTLADQTRWQLPLLGEHNACNAACAIACARMLGLSDETIAMGLADVQGPPMRLERSEIATSTGGTLPIRVVNDCYNANPDSMLAALRAFRAYAVGSLRRVVVLGDMLELGSTGPALHAEVLDDALESLQPHDRLVLVGPIWQGVWAGRAGAAKATTGVVPMLVPTSSEDSLATIAAMLVPGDALLLKGSRGMALERVLVAISQRWAHSGITLSSLPEPKPAVPLRGPTR